MIDTRGAPALASGFPSPCERGVRGLALSTLCLGALACAPADPAPLTDTAEMEEKVVPVATRIVATRNVVDLTSLPADLLPIRRAVLAAEVPGTVARVHVDAGASVRAGDVLLEVDTRTLRQRLKEAEAVHRHRDALFQRAEKLLARRSITEQQYLDAVTERDVAGAQLESARLELEKSRLTAPWSGTVAARRVEAGDYVVPGQPILELLDTRRLKVRSPAPASDVPFLRPGLEAAIRLDVFPGEVFRGSITRLAPELDAAARTLDVEIEIGNPDGRLRPGMYARVEITRRSLADAVLVPLSAVVELENTRVVYVVEAGRAVRRGIELGPVLGDEVVVTDGLVAGQRLIVEGQGQVSPGQKVIDAGDPA